MTDFFCKSMAGVIVAMTENPPIGWGQTVQHCLSNTLLISALLRKNKEVVGENNGVASTMFNNVVQFDSALDCSITVSHCNYDEFLNRYYGLEAL